MVVAAEWGTGQVFWSIMWFTLWIIWISLLFVVFTDVFRSHDLSGWGKALWLIFVIVLPYLGVFVYLIARGDEMQEHAAQQTQAHDAAFRQQVQEVAGSSSTTDELSKLAALKAEGVIDDAEFERLKAKALA